MKTMLLSLIAVLLALSGAATAEETERLMWENREEIPEAYRWNISDILADEAAFDATIAKVEAMLPKLAEYQGRLGESAEVLADAIELSYEMQRTAEDVIVWAGEGQATDTRNQEANGRLARARGLVANAGEATAFLEPEIAAIPADQPAEFMKHERLVTYQHVIDNIVRTSAHIRSAEVEQVLELDQAAARELGAHRVLVHERRGIRTLGDLLAR